MYCKKTFHTSANEGSNRTPISDSPIYSYFPPIFRWPMLFLVGSTSGSTTYSTTALFYSGSTSSVASSATTSATAEDATSSSSPRAYVYFRFDLLINTQYCLYTSCNSKSNRRVPWLSAAAYFCFIMKYFDLAARSMNSFQLSVLYAFGPLILFVITYAFCSCLNKA